MSVPGNCRNQTYMSGHRGVTMCLEPWWPLSAILKPFERVSKKLLSFCLEESEDMQAGEDRKCVSYLQESEGLCNSDICNSVIFVQVFVQIIVQIV